ncbi:MAG: hypothetical protein Q9N34_03215 [Aquificota bacterium]|nr:hypothetical protein [Aquificota bacterium]
MAGGRYGVDLLRKGGETPQGPDEVRSLHGGRKEVLIDRRKKTARLKGDVQIRGDALFVKTDSAHVDFNRDLITGEGGVSLWRGTNYFEGKGFEVRLRPLRVIIGGVRAKHEI